MANKTHSIVLSSDQINQVEKLMTTRTGKTFDEVLANVVRKALDNEIYRQKRNSEQAATKKAMAQVVNEIKNNEQYKEIYDEIASRFGL